MFPSRFVPFLVDRIGWLLIHSLWQYAFIALGMMAVLRMMRRRTAAARYTACLAALAATVIAPAVTWPLLPADTSPRAAVVTDSRMTWEPTADDVEAFAATNATTIPPALEPTQLSSAAPPPESVTTPPVAAETAAPAVRWWAPLETAISPWLPELVAVWCLGVLLFAIRPAWSWCLLRRLRRTGVSIVPEAVQASLADAARRLGVRREVRLLQSTLVTVPMVVGYLRPVILLPLCVVSGFSASEVEAILAHELAHIRRHDYLANLLQTLIETVCFYHPAVWWLSFRIRQEREHCCDELAAHTLGSRAAYGRALLALEELRGTSPVLSLGANSGSLLERIRRLQHAEQTPRLTGGGGTILGVVMVVFLAVACLWGCTPSAAPSNQEITADGDDPEDASTGELAGLTLPKIINAVREQEQRYRNLEYVVRQEYFFRSDHPLHPWSIIGDGTPEKTLPPPPMETSPRVVETIHVVHQGDLVSFRLDRTARTTEGMQPAHRSESAYDGTRTVSVEQGHSANIHLSRYEASQVVPPHVWAMQQLGVNFPLSVFLEGGDALHSHPKVRRGPNPGWYTFFRAETESEPLEIETVGGRRCVKVRMLRRYGPRRRPDKYLLWLAVDRNYLCVKSQLILNLGQPFISNETTADELREIAPGVWLPAKVTAMSYVSDWVTEIRAGPVHSRTTTLVLEEAAVDGQHPPEQFQLAVPEDVPLFTIGPDGLVDSPHHPQPAAKQSGTTLQAIIAAVRRNEQRYLPIDVTVEENHFSANTTELAASGSLSAPPRRQETRIVRIPSQEFWLLESKYRQADGTWSTSRAASADGDNASGIYLPHRWFRRSAKVELSTYLKDGTIEGNDNQVFYEGDDLIDGLLCHRMRRRRDKSPPWNTDQFIWICPERNFLPVRMQWIEPRHSERLPSAIGLLDDIRELQPGLWFPMRWTMLLCNAMDGTGLSENRMIVHTRTEHHVTNVSFDPQIDRE